MRFSTLLLANAYHVKISSSSIVSQTMDYLELIKKDLKDLIKKNYQIEVEPQVTTPQEKVHGDFATNVSFSLSKQLGKPPLLIAEEVKRLMETSELIHKVEVAKPGFINFFIKKDDFVRSSLKAALDNSLIKQTDSVEKVIIEHTSVNPNKAMHIGHLRNAVIGDTIARLLLRLGQNVEIHNYIDDTGVQVADTVNGLMNLNISQPKEQKFDDYCWDVYTAINKEYETSANLKEKRSEILHNIESGEANTINKVNEVVNKILECHLDLMSQFDIRYDLLVYESEIINRGFWETAFEGLKRSPKFILEKEGKNKGCWVLKIENKKYGDKVFIRSNGTKVYTAKDTAYHLWKFGLLGKDFLYSLWPEAYSQKKLWRTSAGGKEMDVFGNGNKIINIIDERQSYPQEVVKYALETLGHNGQSQNLFHIAYGVVALSKDTAKVLGLDTSSEKNVYAMSGRKGIGVKVTDLLNLVTEEINKKQAKQNNDLSIKQNAIAAIKHYMLKYSPTSNIVFDYKQALQMNGNTGPYLQYSHARAASIIKKAGAFSINTDKSEDLTESEKDLIKVISSWGNVAAKTAETLNISAIAEYAFELSKSFHTFYEHNNVLNAEEKVKSFRLTVVQAYINVIRDVLGVLGITAPESM